MPKSTSQSQSLPGTAMIRSLLVLIGLCASLIAHAETCNKQLQAFNSYDQLVDGKLTEKHSVYDLTEWSRDSTYEGILATSQAPEGAELVLEIHRPHSKKASKSFRANFEKWDLDPAYRRAHLVPKTFFGSANSGTYTVRLVKGSAVLCEESFDIADGD